MVAGDRCGAPAWALGGLCALAGLLTAPGLTASALAAGPDPPSAAELARSTRALLEDPAFRAAPSGIDPVDPVDPAASALLPANRVLAFYGAPQLGSTVLGRRRPAAAGRLLARQSLPYERLGDRPVIPAFDLIGVVANSTRGADGLYRTRQPDELIAQYLRTARSFGGRLMLDIQPGRARIIDEIAALEPWIAQPDVDVAIDPEWNVGRRGVPGVTEGTISAREINAASRRIRTIVNRNDLPPKLLVVHQFQQSSIRQRRRIARREGVEVTLNFDGIGDVAPKVAGYEALATRGLFNGFSLFYDLDTPLMKPGAVLALEPVVDFLLYQ